MENPSYPVGVTTLLTYCIVFQKTQTTLQTTVLIF